MPMGSIFWMLMILWFVGFGITSFRQEYASWAWAPNLMLFVLLFLLGWHDFGFVVK